MHNQLTMDIHGSTSLMTRIGEEAFAKELLSLHGDLKKYLHGRGFKLLSFGGDKFVIKFGRINKQDFINLIQSIDSILDKKALFIRDVYSKSLLDFDKEKRVFKLKYIFHILDDAYLKPIFFTPHQQEWISRDISIASKAEKYTDRNTIALSEKFINLNFLTEGLSIRPTWKEIKTLGPSSNEVKFFFIEKAKILKLLQANNWESTPGMRPVVVY